MHKKINVALFESLTYDYRRAQVYQMFGSGYED